MRGNKQLALFHLGGVSVLLAQAVKSHWPSPTLPTRLHSLYFVTQDPQSNTQLHPTVAPATSESWASWWRMWSPKMPHAAELPDSMVDFKRH